MCGRVCKRMKEQWGLVNMEYITKTDFVEGMNCPTYLLLKKNKPELMKATEMDTSAKEGIEVGLVAANLFEDIIKIPFTCSKEEKVERTAAAMNEEKRTTIAEATFVSANLYCQVDYLSSFEEGFSINEVKALTSIRKKNKNACLEDRIIRDLGFQYYVLRQAGVDVRKVNCIYLNENYVRGGSIKHNELFIMDDVTDEIIKYVEEQIEDDIRSLERFISNSNTKDLRSTKCAKCKSFSEYCLRDLPTPNVFDLNGTFCRKRDVFYKEGDITFEKLMKRKDLNTNTRQEIEAEILQREYVDKKSISEFLEGIRLPVYFLDFETYQNAIPEVEGQWPYEQVPFQYSLDIVEDSNMELIHKEFLAEENGDPRRMMAEKLVNDIPKGVCVIAYNISFEKGRLEELAELYPDLKEHLLNIAENLIDLEIPFKKRWYYKREMKGKSSIKKVLPALFPNDPNLNYANLPGVQNGQQAKEMFLKLRDMSDEERLEQRSYMLQYCALDTFAMVKVWEALLQVVDDPIHGAVSALTKKYEEKMF